MVILDIYNNQNITKFYTKYVGSQTQQNREMDSTGQQNMHSIAK
jgi:hypothetical protein